MFLDTQIVSYGFTGTTRVPIEGCHISSVVANEFLEVHARELDTARYYVPLSVLVFDKAGHLGAYLQKIRDRYAHHPFPKYSTDKIALYFGDEYPRIVEYGSAAISRIINERAVRAFRLAVATLDKRKQRPLAKRFEFKYLVI